MQQLLIACGNTGPLDTEHCIVLYYTAGNAPCQTNKLIISRFDEIAGAVQSRDLAIRFAVKMSLEMTFKNI